MKPDFFDYAVIVAATAGTLVYLFLMILIVGYRRRRTFERVLFFLALAAFSVCAGLLLEENALIYYGDRIPAITDRVSLWIAFGSISVLPALLLHAHFMYWRIAHPAMGARRLRFLITLGYGQLLLAPCLGLAVGRLASGDMQNASHDLILGWIASFLLSTVLCVWMQLRFAEGAREENNAIAARYHTLFACGFGLLGLGLLSTFKATAGYGGDHWLVSVLLVIGILPGAIMDHGIVRHGVLGIGAQKNLVYGVTIGFLAILYLALVRRASGWMEPYFPPEATSALLIFVLIGFFEPIQRFANRVLRHSFEKQVGKLQELTKDLQREARGGDLSQLMAVAQRRIREEFGLDVVRLTLGDTTSGVETPDDSELKVGAEAPTPERSGNRGPFSNHAPAEMSGERRDGAELRRPAWAGQPVRFALGKRGAEVGELIAVPIGSSISGETHAALEFLAEQLPGIIELCRAVDEKSRLERELAERERLALVGQMTASISHNLKNPLGSMKTVLQVQLENPRLDESVRRDLQMVLSELDRLSGKLNSLLRYARPAVRSAETARQIEVSRVAAEIVALMNNEAARKDATLQIHDAPNCGCIRGGDEALNDILSNLVVNAIEAVTAGGRVDVRLGGDDSHVEIAVADDGPGIPADQQARLFQPFFTTKANGTGLGLAIVRRRAAELGGIVTWKSPVVGGRGTEFVVHLPRMKC